MIESMLVWYAPQVFELTMAFLLTFLVLKSLRYIVGKFKTTSL